MQSIYALIDPISGDVFYIGKTEHSLKTRLRAHGKLPMKDQSKRAGKVRELQRLGLWSRVTIHLVQSVPNDFIDEAEKYWIAYYRAVGAPLVNSQGGGQGGKQAPESIEKTRQALIGRPKSAEHKAKQSATMTGRKASPETIQKKREATLRRYEDPAERIRTGQARIGYEHPDEVKEKITATNKATWSSPEKRKQHSEMLRQIHQSRRMMEG